MSLNVNKPKQQGVSFNPRVEVSQPIYPEPEPPKPMPTPNKKPSGMKIPVDRPQPQLPNIKPQIILAGKPNFTPPSNPNLKPIMKNVAQLAQKSPQSQQTVLEPKMQVPDAKPVNKSIEVSLPQTSLSADSPEPIDLDENGSNEVNNIQAQLAEQPPVFEDMEDAAFTETLQDKLLEPKIEEALFHTKVGLNKPLKLSCTCTGNPAPKAFWFKEGRQISKKSKHFITRTNVENETEDLKTVKYILYIHQTCQQDDGIYSCVIISPAGLAISSARIVIKTENQAQSAAPVAVPQSTAQNLTPKSQISPQKSPGRNMSGASMPISVATTNDTTSNNLLVATTNLDQLSIKSASELMAEDYESQNLSPNRNLNVNTSSVASPNNLNKLVSPNSNNGLNLVSPIQGLTSPEIPVHNRNLSGVSSDLPFQKTNRPESNNSARNSPMLGRAKLGGLNRPASRGGFLPKDQLKEETNKLKPSPGMPARGQIEEDEEVPTEKFYRPHFLQMPPPEINVMDGKFVRIDVKVTGLPIPHIEFLKDGYPIRRDHKHKIVVRENNVHSLLIERADHNIDSGEYVIQATNKAGIQAAKCRLNVQPKLEMVRPSFIKRMQGPQRLGLGETLVLEIQAKGHPPPQMGWKKGSDGIIPNDERIILDYDETTNSQKLTIFNVTKYDQGWYTCSAVNRAGIASCTCKVDILDEWELEHMRSGEDKDGKHSTGLYSSSKEDAYQDSPHLVVQKSSRLSHMQPELREALRDAYSADAQK